MQITIITPIKIAFLNYENNIAHFHVLGLLPELSVAGIPLKCLLATYQNYSYSILEVKRFQIFKYY